jgi:hypothetical protein
MRPREKKWLVLESAKDVKKQPRGRVFVMGKEIGSPGDEGTRIGKARKGGKGRQK